MRLLAISTNMETINANQLHYFVLQIQNLVFVFDFRVKLIKTADSTVGSDYWKLTYIQF